MNYNNYASNNFASRYVMQQPAHAPHRQHYQQQQQSVGQGSAFGANSFFGAGANNFFNASANNFFSNPFGQQAGGGASTSFNQVGSGSNSNFTSSTDFFRNSFSQFGSQTGSQSATITNGSPIMNVNFGTQPMPPHPVVVNRPVCDIPPAPPVIHPPAPPVVVPPPAPPVQTNFVGLAGDPIGYGQDLAGKTVDAPQNTGYHNLYVNGEGFAGNAAGGQLSGMLNRQQPLTSFGTAVKEANAQSLYQGGVPHSGIAVNSLVEQLNAKEPHKVANTQYGVTVGDHKVQLAGGLTQVIKPDGTTVTLKPDGSEFKIGDLATIRAGVVLPGSGEARTVLAYNEKLNGGGTSTDLLTFGFRTPDGLGATERASAGYADGVARFDSNGNKNYYDFQVVQNAQPNQLG